MAGSDVVERPVSRGPAGKGCAPEKGAELLQPPQGEVRAAQWRPGSMKF